MATLRSLVQLFSELNVNVTSYLIMHADVCAFCCLTVNNAAVSQGLVGWMWSEVVCVPA